MVKVWKKQCKRCIREIAVFYFLTYGRLLARYCMMYYVIMALKSDYKFQLKFV